MKRLTMNVSLPGLSYCGCLASKVQRRIYGRSLVGRVSVVCYFYARLPFSSVYNSRVRLLMYSSKIDEDRALMTR
jgi:hypothetical protein